MNESFGERVLWFFAGCVGAFIGIGSCVLLIGRILIEVGILK